MKLCEWCNTGQVRGAHTVCELCWKRHILRKQDKQCVMCLNDPDNLDAYDWRYYDVNDASVGELVCKKCARKARKAQKLQPATNMYRVNRRVNPDLVTGQSYYDKLIKCGVDGETAGRIHRELEAAVSEFVISRAKAVHAGQATEVQRRAHVRRYASGFKRRELCRILLREDMRGIAAQLNLLPKPKPRPVGAGQAVNVSTLPLDMRGAYKIEGPPVMTEGDCKLLGLPIPPKKKQYKPKAAEAGPCSFYGCTNTATNDNGLCDDCNEMVM